MFGMFTEWIGQGGWDTVMGDRDMRQEWLDLERKQGKASLTCFRNSHPSVRKDNTFCSQWCVREYYTTGKWVNSFEQILKRGNEVAHR